MPSVSVIVPVYNVEDYLDRCLDSLVSQSLEDMEIIVVDDGSDDNSASIIDRYVSLYPNIIALHVPNGGVSKARNIGIEKAIGRYIGFVDSDDYVSPLMFEKMLDSIERTGSDVVQCMPSGERGDEKPSSSITGKDEIVTAYMDGVITNCVWDKLYSRTLIGDIRFPEDLRFAEDFEFNASVLSRSSKVSFIPDKLYYYTVRESSESHRGINSKHLEGFRVYDFLRDKCPSNSALRERELSESLRFLDSIIGHGEIGKEYEKELMARIRNNRKYIAKNRYLSRAGKIRSRFILLFPSLYVSLVALSKRLRGKNV